VARKRLFFEMAGVEGQPARWLVRHSLGGGGSLGKGGWSEVCD